MAITFLTNEDEKNFIKTINGNAPDENGNVEVTTTDSSQDATQSEWRHIRTVTIPEDITTDTSGVIFAEQATDGVLFGFDTDENGEAFTLKELIIFSYAGTLSQYGDASIAINTEIPTYGADKLQTMVALGKDGTFTYNVTHTSLFDDGCSFGYGGSFGGGNINDLHTPAKKGASAGLTRIEKISTYLNNGGGYGFITGSIFEFYGR